MAIEIKGLEEAKRKLEELQRKAKDLQGKQGVSFAELFPSEFIRKHTDYESFENLLDASGFNLESQEDFEHIPDEEWDTFIKTHSRFATWKEMLRIAGQEYIARKMGF